MNISYNWLKKYLDFDLTPDQLADALTSIGLETGSVEEVESIRGGLKGLVIAKVLTCVDHPGSDHLHITTVDLGDGEATQIVCGAPNVAAGQTVVVATVGTTLYDGDKEFRIKKSKIRGVESMGMICAEDEIGVGTSHDGIIVITDDVKPGTPAAEYYNLTSDYVLEVDLTPNRIDAASHYGVARDLAAWMSRHPEAGFPCLRTPDADLAGFPHGDGKPVDVTVEDTAACTRYSGITIRNITVKESPQWLKDCLTAIGQRPINNIVDITNYVLFGIGQPLHCFDVDKIKGGRVVVTTRPDGTPFTTLDGVERKLDSRDLMICNTEEAMCIAGVFGGLDSGVTEGTTSVFIESACFNPTSVRKTARRHGLSTDASFRYERGVDPNGTMRALRVAAALILELAGGEICGAPVDIYPAPVEPYKVAFSYDGMNCLVGKDIPRDTVDSILRALEIEIAGRDGDCLDLRVPTYRVDVRRQCDVIEDVLRIYGYNNVEISTTVHSSLSYKSMTDRDVELTELVCEQLTGAGFSEILNNSLTAEGYYRDSQEYPLDTCVRLLNPLSNDLCLMRRTLLFGGLEVISHNINRRMPDLMLYEMGHVYSVNPAVESTPEKPLAPFSEASRLGIWMTGALTPDAWNRTRLEATFYDLRAVVDNILTRLGLSSRELKYTTQPASGLYAASMTVATRSGKLIGTLGIVAPALLKRFDIKQPVMYAEMCWDELVKLSAARAVQFTPLSKTQPVSRDLALLIDTAVTMADVERVVRDSEKRLLKGVRLFDVYEGSNLPAGKKSYAINITLQDDEKTLQDKQIEAVMTKIVNNLKKQLGAELR